MFKKLSLSKLFFLFVSLKRSKRHKAASHRKKATIHFKKMSDTQLYDYTLKLRTLCNTMPEFSEQFREALDKATANLPVAMSDFTTHKTPVAEEQMKYWRIYSKVVVMQGVKYLNNSYFTDKTSWYMAGFAPKPFTLRKAMRIKQPRIKSGRTVAGL